MCAGICLAAFAPVGITIASQVLEIQKQLSKRFEDEDSDDDESAGYNTSHLPAGASSGNLASSGRGPTGRPLMTGAANAARTHGWRLALIDGRGRLPSMHGSEEHELM